MALERQDWERVARLLGAEEGLRRRYDLKPYVDASNVNEDGRAAARAALGDQCFADLFAESETWTMEQAIEYARENG